MQCWSELPITHRHNGAQLHSSVASGSVASGCSPWPGHYLYSGRAPGRSREWGSPSTLLGSRDTQQTPPPVCSPSIRNPIKSIPFSVHKITPLLLNWYTSWGIAWRLPTQTRMRACAGVSVCRWGLITTEQVHAHKESTLKACCQEH